MTGGTVIVENLTYTQIKEMMIQRWESMKALRKVTKVKEDSRRKGEEWNGNSTECI
jgi:hypothetical protein